ncbi:hypothetical protein NAL32_12770 [Chryseobacterium sp. Ch-15]|uniref:Conjugal transfer protein TraD n=1 Tax=Chryseobacterium muglaense TaxID=2893752 RepID=A0A9Q3UW83_9FLAO|nr:hypothetical protein [Chryseobacterium muglaense]MBD3905392.1 hypothetical protein [Chryseobacterium muglaense]MCC9036883.1 hypothetical protein [Chryseobacterium muglaense]MCM2555255.1 hypothetical protein [Chryseobacterium muglaense]
MEKIIIISLIIIVVILLDRKFSINISRKDNDIKTTKITSVIGDTKQIERQPLPIDANERQYEFPLPAKDNFESEIKEEELDDVGSFRDPSKILVKNEDLEQEDEDWKYEQSKVESGFATGVTFQELSIAGLLLQEEVLEPNLEQRAVNIIQKIQGTELFDLLENSLGDASKKIAILLSGSILNEDMILSSKRSNSSDDFDIGEFV